ncbi:MAG: hypothetical protein R3302_06900 [Sulfurimonadaceae bacterium]|nr:hypothetical protein [Sulfurimonadaceae bacterium]
MPDFSQSVSATFIVGTILVIFAAIGLGIAAVKRAKKEKESA